MNPVDLADLYVTPPDQFVRRRNELAASAQGEGDRAAASDIKKLRKPTLAAWLANLLVHEHPDQLNGLLELGETLRTAQVNLTGSEMRRLAQQRHEVIATLVAEAQTLADNVGQPVNHDAARELEATLSAAMADASAAEQLLSGRLTSSLSYSGFGPLTGGAATPMPAQNAEPSRVTTVVDASEQRRREAAETALREARDAAAAAQQLLDEREQDAARLRTERDRLAVEVDELEGQLERARSAAVAADRELRVAERSLREARRRQERAADRVARASSELDRTSQ